MISTLLTTLLCAVLGATIALAVLAPGSGSRGLTQESLDALAASGVSNPVTAVLLNYRGYDTLLEIAVLLLAVVTVWGLRVAPARGDRGETDRPLLASLVRLVAPVAVTVAGYFLWIGSFAPGGAFQAGAVLGGLGVLALLAGLVRVATLDVAAVRVALAFGLLVFVAASTAAMVRTGGLLAYPPGEGGTWILLIEAAATVSIGATLAALFLGGRPGACPPREGGGDA